LFWFGHQGIVREEVSPKLRKSMNSDGQHVPRLLSWQLHWDLVSSELSWQEKESFKIKSA
jgi:hypothetical protein